VCKSFGITTNVRPSPKGNNAHVFFTRDFLEQAYCEIWQFIPDHFCAQIHARDDEMLYFSAAQIPTKVRLLPKAVCHLEERNLVDAIRHSYGFGKSAKILTTVSVPNNPL